MLKVLEVQGSNPDKEEKNKQLTYLYLIIKKKIHTGHLSKIERSIKF